MYKGETEPYRREERQEEWERSNQNQQERGRDYGENPPLDNKPVHQPIYVILGNESMGGDSTSRKAYARQAYRVASIMEVKENEKPITFMSADRGDIIIPHDDPLVISIIIAKHPISRILVDNGSSVNLIYGNYFGQIDISHDQLKKVYCPLYSFTRDVTSHIER